MYCFGCASPSNPAFISSTIRRQQGSSPAIPPQLPNVLNNRQKQASLECRALQQRQGNGAQPRADAQERLLAEADRQAKELLYVQILDRQQSSQSVELSTSGRGQPAAAKQQALTAQPASTELIFRLERRGEGWGEEIFPHLVVEQRPWTDSKRRDRNRSSRPKPWTVRPFQRFCATPLAACARSHGCWEGSTLEIGC